MQHQYAQTNLQLYAQLFAAGFEESDVVSVKTAYDFSTELFSTMLRPSGKPFICHTVGVASILATEGASLELIRAALVHAAYSHGGLRSAEDKTRQQLVSDKLGADIEIIVREAR